MKVKFNDGSEVIFESIIDIFQYIALQFDIEVDQVVYDTDTEDFLVDDTVVATLI